jgi:hypothetical protein
MLLQQRSQIEDAIVEAESNNLENQAAECGIDLSDFDNILQPIISRCTKHDIEAGTSWILRKGTSSTSSAVMFKYLLRKFVDSFSNFIWQNSRSTFTMLELSRVYISEY